MASCDNAPGESAEELMIRKPKFDKAKTCVKCKVEQGNLVVRHAVYCKACFAPFVLTKFKRCLTPHINAAPSTTRRGALRASGNLLLGFSGGLGSSVLLDIVHACYFLEKDNSGSTGENGTNHPGLMPIWDKCTVCYVELCGAFPEMRDRTEEARRIVRRYARFDFVPVRLEDAFDEKWWKSVGGKSSQMAIDVADEGLPTLPNPSVLSSPLSSLHAYLSSLPTPTARHTAVHTIIRLLLLYSAGHTRSSHLLLGSSLTSLAVSLISGVALGGGFNVRDEIEEVWGGSLDDAQRCNVRIVRPLREVGMKECAAWAWWGDLKMISQDPRWMSIPGSVSHQNNSISSLTRDFIVGLERDYPSTVSTITRTCAKLAPKKDKAGITCALCERPAQEGVQDWKSQISVRAFLSDSTTAFDTLPPSSSLTSRLCYACHTMFTSRSSGTRSRTAPTVDTGGRAVPMPFWVGTHVVGAVDGEVWEAGRMSQRKMQDTVKDFLLDGD